MGWIIFAFVLVVLVLEVLVGALRGGKFSGIRFVYTLLGTLVAALLAKSLTIKIILAIAEASGYAGDNLTEVVASFFVGTSYASIGSALAPHIAGLSLSIMIPLVFVPLFLVFKLIGLFLYLITKAIVNKATGKKNETRVSETGEVIKLKRPVYSRVIGGVLGALTALFTCAFITMPLFNTVSAINDSGMKDTIFAMLENADSSTDSTASAKNERVTAVLEALAYGDATPVYAADTTDTAIDVAALRSLFDSVANSPALAVFKYTGVQAASNAIINSASTVKPEDVGAEDVKTESYNLNESLTEIIQVVEPVTDLITAVASGEDINIDDLDKVNEFAEKLEEAGFLDNEDKLEILNSCKEVITEAICEQFGIDASDADVSDYENVEQFTQDVQAIVDMGKVLAEVAGDSGNGTGTFSADSLENIDVEALINDPEKLKSFVSSTLSLSNGTEIIASLINTYVSQYTDGKYTNVVTAASLDAVGRDNLIELADSLMKFTKYDENSTLTPELKQEIMDAIDEVAAKGVISKEIAEEIKKEIY